MVWTTEKLVAYIRYHGMEAYALNGSQISARDMGWETIPATYNAVRIWLGY